nr:DUF5009 domain-containing protein [Thalassotalea sp. G2M2-11]
MAKCHNDRLLALDVLRGITITAMVIVNNPGSWSHIYAPLKHAHWHGLTPTDLIFPFFVFMVGVSIGIVQHRKSNTLALHKTVWLRSAKLFGLGLFLFLFYFNFQSATFNWFTDRLSQIRWMGVLQRLALVYLLTYYLAHYLTRKGLWWAFVCTLAVYWLSMMYIPYTSADGTEYVGQLLFGNNFAAYLDATLLGKQHLYYQKATPFPFDPEGIWSTIPAIASAISGVLTGQYLLSPNNSTPTKAKKLCLFGGLALILGYTVANDFPINKQLWSPSFVLVSSAWALIILSGLIWLLDVKHYRRWSAPFVVFGMNAIGFFVLSGVIARVLLMIPAGEVSLKSFLYNTVFSNLFSPTFGSFAFALCFCGICYWIFYQLYQKQIFFKV